MNWPFTVALMRQARAHALTETRPSEPSGGSSVDYRGWECGYEADRAHWTGQGYVAYRGGCDLDAYYVEAATWGELLGMVDDEEDEACGRMG